MNIEHKPSIDHSPDVLDISGPSEMLGTHLLHGQLIRYKDDRFQVSSGESWFILKLAQAKEKFTLFYAQVPSIYPLPDDLKKSIQMDLEACMKKPVIIEFINAGTLKQGKKIFQHASLIGD